MYPDALHFGTTYRTARHPRICGRCDRRIGRGERYERQAYKTTHGIEVVSLHTDPDCDDPNYGREY